MLLSLSSSLARATMSTALWMPYTPAEAHRRTREVEKNEQAAAALKDQEAEELAATQAALTAGQPQEEAKATSAFGRPGIKGLVPLNFKGPRRGADQQLSSSVPPALAGEEGE